MKVTAVLITYKRQYNIPRIVEHLLSRPYIDEIIIHDNSKDENTQCYARYEAAYQAKNDIIYVQDDDCIVQGIDDVYAEFLAHQDRVVCGLTTEAVDEYREKDFCLVGWGTFFRKARLTALHKYLDHYPDDYLFQREADRIFTALQKEPHRVVDAETVHLTGHNDASAMSSTEEHNRTRDEALKRCREIQNKE